MRFKYISNYDMYFSVLFVQNHDKINAIKCVYSELSTEWASSNNVARAAHEILILNSENLLLSNLSGNIQCIRSANKHCVCVCVSICMERECVCKRALYSDTFPIIIQSL